MFQKQNQLKAVFNSNNILDFHFQKEKNLLSILTSESNQLYQQRCNVLSLSSKCSSKNKLINTYKHSRVFKDYFKGKASPGSANLNMFLHHSIYTTEHFLHVDNVFRQYKTDIREFKVDSYGLIGLSAGNSIFLSKYLNILNSQFSVNNKSTKIIKNLAELHHEGQSDITSFDMKNSLLISGSRSGQINLWDINCSKVSFSAQYLKYPIRNVGTYLNFQDKNLFYVNYAECQNILMCDIRTNKPIKIANTFSAQIDCYVTNKGCIIGVGTKYIDTIDINSGFKSFRKVVRKQKLKTQSENQYRVSKNFKLQNTDQLKQNIIPTVIKRKNLPYLLEKKSQKLNNQSQTFRQYDSFQGIDKPRFKQLYSNQHNPIRANQKICGRQSKEIRKKEIKRINKIKAINNSVLCQKHEQKTNKQQILSEISCSCLTDAHIVIGKTNGSIEWIPLSKLHNQSSISTSRNLHKVVNQTQNNVPIVKIQELHQDFYALNAQGFLYKIKYQ